MTPLACPHCGSALPYRPDLAGMTFSCPQCNGAFTIPAPLAPMAYQPPQIATQQAYGHESHQVRTQHTTVHVNVPRQHSNSLGTASVILGIVSLFVCWLPWFGLPLSLLGTLLGIFGLLVAMMRKGAGLGMPIAGTAISGLVLATSVYFWGGLALLLARASNQAAKDKQHEAEPARPASRVVRSQPSAPRPATPLPPAVIEPPKVPEPEPTPIAAPSATPAPTLTFDKPWQASRKWLLADGRVVEGRLRTWSRFKVVIVQPDGQEVATNIDGVSQTDQDWVDAQIAK